MIEPIINWFFYSLLGLDPSSHLVASVHFFIYDTIKIIALLFVMISFMGFLRSFLDQQ